MTKILSENPDWEFLIFLCIITAGLIFAEELIFAAIGAGVIPNV